MSKKFIGFVDTKMVCKTGEGKGIPNELAGGCDELKKRAGDVRKRRPQAAVKT